MKTKLDVIYKTLGAFSIIVVLFLLNTTLATEDAKIELWPGLKAGPYPVGYKLVHTYDNSRSFGKHVKRPIQITVWYPSAPDSKGRHMTIESYLLSSATEIDFSAGDGRFKTKNRDEVVGMAIEAGADADRLDKILARQTLSIPEVPPAPGSFPLLLYAPGKNGPAYQSLVLCEYLASCGYVVAASPSIGRTEREILKDNEGLETGEKDLEFVLAEARKLTCADEGRIGLIGYSFGGMTASLLAMHNDAVDALLLLDPGFRVSKNYEMLREYPSYRPERIRQPIMVMLAKGKGSVPDLSFIESTSSQDLTIAVIQNFMHGDFGSMIIELFAHPVVGENVRNIEGIDAGYANVCIYVKAFFDRHLKADKMAAAFLKRKPEENGVPPGLMTVEQLFQKNSPETKKPDN